MFNFTFFTLDAPWCGHCKALAPEYAKAAAKLAEENSNILLGKVDATEESELAERFKIRGYPTLKFFNKGKEIEYNGGRTADQIVLWLNKKTGPPATELSTAEAVSEFVQSKDVVVVGYFADKESADAKVFLEVAAENDEIPFGITSDEAVAKAAEVTKEGVTLFKKFDEKKNVFESTEFTVENLKKFVSFNSLPLVVEFSHEVKFC